jgi:hypothetical protein
LIGIKIGDKMQIFDYATDEKMPIVNYL